MKHVLFKVLKVIIIIILLFAGYVYWIDNHLVVSEYQVKAPVTETIRILQLTDLHNKQFGKNNRILIEKIREQKPDIVVMTGDMLNAEDENTEIVMNLVSEISPFVPVYFGYGNHEFKWVRTRKRDLSGLIEEQGAVVVDNSYVDVEIKGQKIRIGGYMGYYHCPHMLTNDKEQQKRELEFAEDFEQTDLYKILLNHIPTQWVDWHYVNTVDVDLIFCGHYHGGVIRIPFIERGLFAPYIGWFPENIRGQFEGKKGTCILSTGLGSEYPIPRLNNPPEIVVVDIVP